MIDIVRDQWHEIASQMDVRRWYNAVNPDVRSYKGETKQIDNWGRFRVVFLPLDPPTDSNTRIELDQARTHRNAGMFDVVTDSASTQRTGIHADFLSASQSHILVAALMIFESLNFLLNRQPNIF